MDEGQRRKKEKNETKERMAVQKIRKDSDTKEEGRRTQRKKQ